MQIHDIAVSEARKHRKRIGRGGKRGTYSGRGNKGQKARSGAHVNPLFEGGRSSLVERLKKVRGFKSIHGKKPFVKLSDISKAFSSGETVSMETLFQKKLIKKNSAHESVKVIGTGVLPKGIIFGGELSFSDGVRLLIRKFDGKILEKREETREIQSV